MLTFKFLLFYFYYDDYAKTEPWSRVEYYSISYEKIHRCLMCHMTSHNLSHEQYIRSACFEEDQGNWMIWMLLQENTEKAD